MSRKRDKQINQTAYTKGFLAGKREAADRITELEDDKHWLEKACIHSYDAWCRADDRITELEAIENGLDDRITVLEDYITKLETTARRYALESMN